MNTLFKNIFRFLGFMLLQVYVLDTIRLHQMITPYIYFLFLLWLPFNINRILLMMLALVLGFTLDSFRHNPGFHTAACVLLAYVRPFLINLMIPQQELENNHDEPSSQTMGGWLPYLFYAGILMLFHNAWLFFLEAWQFGNAWYFFQKTIGSTAISLLLLLVIELIFSRKQKYRAQSF